MNVALFPADVTDRTEMVLIDGNRKVTIRFRFQAKLRGFTSQVVHSCAPLPPGSDAAGVTESAEVSQFTRSRHVENLAAAVVAIRGGPATVPVSRPTFEKKKQKRKKINNKSTLIYQPLTLARLIY